MFEQPWSANSWKEPSVQGLMRSETSFLARCDQCCFGQQDAAGQPIRKRTGFLTNCSPIAKILNRSCRKQHQHQACVGSVAGQSRARGAARYTNQLVDAVLRQYVRTVQGLRCSSSCIHISEVVRNVPMSPGCSHDMLVEYPMHLNCLVPESIHHTQPQPQSMQLWSRSTSSVDPIDQFALQEAEPPSTEESDDDIASMDPQVRRQIMREIDRTHKGLGHPSLDRFLRILRMGGASKVTMKLARTYTCSQCLEDTRPKPWRRAAPPRELGFNQVVGVDLITLKHHEEKLKCLNIVCWGSRYQMVLPLRATTSQAVREAYRMWIRNYGAPRLVKADLGKEFQKEFSLRCASDGSELDPSSLESPTQNAITEREGKSYKMMFSKTSLEYGPINNQEEFLELIDTVTMMKNRLLHKSGFSAVHCVLRPPFLVICFRVGMRTTSCMLLPYKQETSPCSGRPE